MTDDKSDEVIAEFLETRARSATGDLTSLTDEQRAEVQPLLGVAELLWEAGHGAPPLEDDPVAAMLGLVHRILATPSTARRWPVLGATPNSSPADWLTG